MINLKKTLQELVVTSIRAMYGHIVGFVDEIGFTTLLNFQKVHFNVLQFFPLACN
jgi:hypothetical protein